MERGRGRGGALRGACARRGEIIGNDMTQDKSCEDNKGEIQVNLKAELDQKTHVLHLYRRWKTQSGQIYETIFAKIALTAQAETLVNRAMEAGLEDGDCDCWLLAAGTEFSDPAFKQEKNKPYITL
jgi:hypothetical protein